MRFEGSERFDGKVAVHHRVAAIGFGRAFADGARARGCRDRDRRHRRRSRRRRPPTALEADGHAALVVDCDVADEEQVQRGGGRDRRSLRRHRRADQQRRPAPAWSTTSRSRVLAARQAPAPVRRERDRRRELHVGVPRPSMAARGGGAVIVNISSMAAHLSTTPYAVSKLAVRGPDRRARHRVRARPDPGERDRRPGSWPPRTRSPTCRSELVDDFVNEQAVGAPPRRRWTTSSRRCCTSAPTSRRSSPVRR